MTHPDRVRRGRPAPRRRIPYRSSEHAAQQPAPELATSTTPGHTAIDGGGLAGRHVARQSQRGITRPPRSGTSDELASAPVLSAGAAGDSRSAAPLLYTAEQAASLLQVRPSWLRRKAAARAVPCRFVGKHLRFSRTDIEAIADGNTP